MNDESVERPDRHWHVDKRVSVSHLLTTLTIVVGLLIWGAKQESRISVLEKTFEIQAQNTQLQFSDIKGHLVRIEAKLDVQPEKRK